MNGPATKVPRNISLSAIPSWDAITKCLKKTQVIDAKGNGMKSNGPLRALRDFTEVRRATPLLDKRFDLVATNQVGPGNVDGVLHFHRRTASLMAESCPFSKSRRPVPQPVGWTIFCLQEVTEPRKYLCEFGRFRIAVGVTPFPRLRKCRICVGQNDRRRLGESLGRFGFIVRRSFIRLRLSAAV